MRCSWEAKIHRLGRILLIVYFMETGIVLLVAPWSPFWDRNWFVDGTVGFQILMGGAALRGAVSGVGIVSLCAGLWELVVTGASWGATLFGDVSTPPLRGDLSEPDAAVGRSAPGAGPAGGVDG